MDKKIVIVGEKREAMEQILYNAKALEDKILLSKTKNKSELERIMKSQGYIEGEKYILTWAVGHLFIIEIPERIDPTYSFMKPFKNDSEYSMLKLKDAPFVLDNDPTRYDPKYQKEQREFSKFKDRQYSKILSILKRKDIEEIILFGDADAEGERIAREPVVEAFKTYPDLKKINITRAWCPGSYKSKPSVQKALNERKSYLEPKYDNLFKSALSRAKNDYISGMKSGKVLSNKYKRNLTTGRVQASLLSIIYKRHQDREDFKPKPFWKLKGLYKDLIFDHFYYNEDVNDQGKPIKTKENYYWIKEDLEEVIKQCEDKKLKGKVLDFNVSKRVSKKPILYSTNTFQADFIGKEGVSNEQATYALEYLRQEGFTSYPRTNGHYFAKSDISEVSTSLASALEFYKSFPIVKENLKTIKIDFSNSIFDDKKAATQSHTPINITEKIPTEKDFTKWESVVYKGKKLKKLKEAYELIAKRLLIQFLPDDLIEKQNLLIDINGNLFETTGEKPLKNGWRELTGEIKKDNSFKTNLKKGDEIQLDSLKMDEGTTSMPPLFNEKSLGIFMVNVNKALDQEISEIEDKKERIKKREEYKELKKIFLQIEGIGTDASRIDIISKLYNKKYISITGKNRDIDILESGIFFVERLPEYLRQIKTTALWEIELEKIRLGKKDYKKFIEEIDEIYVKKVIPEILKKFYDEEKTVFKPSEAQLKFAKKIAEDKKITIKKEILESKILLSKWIDENFDEKSISYSFSEKQKNILLKSEKEDIKKIGEKEKITKIEFEKGKKYIDNFFKSLKSGKSVSSTTKKTSSTSSGSYTYKFSEKQLNIFNKNADENMKKIANKKSLTKEEFTKCKEWLDNFFKSLKK